MDVFTSITLNYLPKARILAQTLKQFHPDWTFHLFICERRDAQTREADPIIIDKDLFDQIVWLNETDIPDLSTWVFKHTVVELCTAVKGYYLYHLAQQGVEKIIYIDPDIAIFNDLGQLDTLLEDNGILLIPHLVDYTDDPHSIMDNEINGAMRHGVFNFGFLGVNSKREDGKRFINWWWNRLYDYCYADYDRGLFTDQKWGDLIPSFFEDHYIIRDPGYDVASWNLDCRQVSFDPAGQLIINGQYPLRFYHFTGYDSGAGMGVVDYLTAGGNNAVVKELWDWYNFKLNVNGHAELVKHPCSYDYFENGKKILKEMRLLYRSRPDLQLKFTDPFTTSSRDCYYNWYIENVPRK